MNLTSFQKIEIDTEKIESFIREDFERKLGKENVLDIRLSSYPNEYLVAVTLRKETPKALDIAHELNESFSDNNLPIAVYTREVQEKALAEIK
jgi:hypothetical protein